MEQILNNLESRILNQVITTSDGSHSVLNTALGEPYHSIHGAVQESMHVFIGSGLDYSIKTNPLKNIKILEIGFGTGLNALLTLHYISGINAQVHYTALEAYPIDQAIVEQLNYPAVLPDEKVESFFFSLHKAPWGLDEHIKSNFTLLKQQTTLKDAGLGTEKFDLVYFDAFSPNKQPELWELPMLAKVVRSMNAGAVFVTFCAKGQLKRDLKSLGLIVETLPGPPGKKEMVRATKLS